MGVFTAVGMLVGVDVDVDVAVAVAGGVPPTDWTTTSGSAVSPEPQTVW